ncbi:MAG: hypothetical protein H8Z69_00335 [Nanohaloarchaea archaeon]|nr:hypothetical protein [Candidatus Nanohaloarchaea archaeon]
MGLEDNYLEYVAEFSLVMLALSSAYFFNTSKITTGVFLIPVTILFGYTAFISSESFHFSSLLTIFALPFLLIEKLAPIAIIIILGNILTSVFASGDSFKDYYSSVSLPMLTIGVLLGAGLFVGASTQPSFENQIESSVSGFMSDQTSKILDASGIMETQKNAGERVIRQTSRASISLTQQHVLNNSGDLSREANMTILDSFSNARNEVPETLINQSKSGMNTEEMVEEVSSNMSSFLTDNLILLVPVVALGFYSLHPLIGVFTALSALIFRLLAGKLAAPES